jgi:hypothetical protein
MVSHLFFYQLALLTIIGLFIMLHLSWLRPSATNATAPATAITPKRTRSPEPQAFAGLTPKPHCVLCEQATRESAPPPPVPPAPMPPPTAAPGRWIHPGTFVPTPRVTIAAGWS